MILKDDVLINFIRKSQQEIMKLSPIPINKKTLIVFEGLDGSGKSTQVKLLYKLLKKVVPNIVVSHWNSSQKISNIIKELKEKKDLKPQTWALLEAADLYERLRKEIIPTLDNNGIVICDRYYFTPLVRGYIRGLNPKWLLNLYKYVPKPDIIFYFKIDPNISISRVLKRSKELTLSDIWNIKDAIKFYESGQDLNLHNNPLTNFYMFQKKMCDLYDKIFKILKDKVCIIDANQGIHEVYEKILDYLRENKILGKLKKFKDIIYHEEFTKGSLKIKEGEKIIMPCNYGFIPNTIGEDLMELDVLVGDNENSNLVIKIYHTNKKGEFKEIKYAIGFNSIDEAIKCYDTIYPDRDIKYKIIDWDKFKKEINENKNDPKTKFIENLINISINEYNSK
jgi:dTMP kinase